MFSRLRIWQLTRDHLIVYDVPVELLAFLNKNKDGLTILVTSTVALVGAGWAYFKYGRDNAKLKEPAKAEDGPGAHIGGGVQTVSGSITVVGRDFHFHQHQEPSVVVDKLLARNEHLNRRLREVTEQKKALVAAVSNLQKRQLTVTSPSSIDAALEALERGNTDAAERLFLREAERGDENAGRAYRHLGALAFLHDTHKALDAYRKATDRDPRDPEGWNQLGHLLLRIGELDEAQRAYEVELELSGSDRILNAVACCNLGNVYQTRGELDRAVEFYEKALALHTEQGNKAGMAAIYCNLGIVYDTRGELDRAIEFYEMALPLHTEQGDKAGMANDYCNLGVVYKALGDQRQLLLPVGDN